MKKSLLFSAAAFFMAGSFYVSAADVWNIETVWAYNQVGTQCDPIQGLDGDWGGLQYNPASVSATCSRFATGLNGKLITVDDIRNAIVTVDGNNSIETLVTLPTRTAELWPGTAVATDDAGNVIFNYCFTDAKKSIQQWGVVDKNKNITNINLSTPLSELGTTGRVDCLGHVVGDVNSPEGGIGYITMKLSGTVLMLHFKGDGTKVTSLTAIKCTTDIEGIKAYSDSQLFYAVPSYFTVSEILAAEYPQNCFYAPYGQVDWEANQQENKDKGSKPISEGWIAAFNQAGAFEPLTGIGNRCRGAIGALQHDGKTYLVRNYVTPEFFAAHDKISTSVCSMNYGIFDLSGNCVASWQQSEAAGNLGMTSIAVEKTGDNTYNIYTYYCYAGQVPDTGTAPGVYAALTKLTITSPSEAFQGSGTEADPYIIASKEDLMNAYLLIDNDNPGATVYFKQTADIDMAGVENYQALNGWYGAYYGKFSYDGNYHVIKNFGPKDRTPYDGSVNSNGVKDGYYCQTIFGVAAGEIKNLGVIDCNIIGSPQGAGGLAGWGGHSNSTSITVDNVFVTGKVTGDRYSGGFFGSTGNNVDISNSYAVVTVEDNKFAGGFVGRLNHPTTISKSYVKADVSGTGTKGLVAGSNAAVDITTNSLVVVGEGDLVGGKATLQGSPKPYPTMAEAESVIISKLPAFSEGKKLGDNPTLNWYTPSEVSGPGTGTEADPYIIATAEDLCNAYKYLTPGAKLYFKQTADIDMKDVENYTAIVGFKGGWPVDNGQFVYNNQIFYDGGNHIIRNFAPTARGAEDNNGYYCQTIFGVAAGEIKNLGIIDCNIQGATQGVGALAAYGGHVDATSVTVDNVFVTGKMQGTGYTGGFFGTSGNDVNITNSYAVVDITTTGYAGGLVGRLRNTMTVENGYVAATVNGPDGKSALVAASDKTPVITGTRFIAIGSGNIAAGATASGINQVEALDEATISRIQKLAAFDEKKMLNGNPTLNWLTDDQLSGVDDVVVDNDDNENAPVEYYNLQGMRVMNPSNGIYIKRQGNKVTKIMVR